MKAILRTSGRIAAFVVLLAISKLAVAVDKGAIDKFVQQTMKADKMPSISVAVLKDGRLEYAKTFGYANLELKAPASNDTVYEIGSVTKQFTAVLTLMLVEEGKVRLDESIAAYVANLPDAWKPITVRHCLTHTSGIKDYLGMGFNIRKDYSQEEVVKLVSGQKLDYAPGEGWSYTNTGFYLLGMMLEKVTGKKYSELLSERIFKPLNMSQSRTMSVMDVIPNRAGGYVVQPKATSNCELLREASGWSAGAILSTATDMAKWDAALSARKLLKPESYDLMWAPVGLNTGRTYPYGFGWFIHQAFGDNLIEHGGNTFGQSAGNWFFMKKGQRLPSERGTVTVIALANKAAANFGALPYLIANLYDPSVIGVQKSPTTDPDPGLTRTLRDSVNLFMNGQFKPELHSSEFIESYKTARHRAVLSAFKSKFGRVLAMRFVDSEDLPHSKLIRYLLTTEKTEGKVGMMMEVSPDGKLVRLEASRLR